MYINGNWDEILVGGRFDVCNPANGEKIADVPDGGREDAERAINAASGSTISIAAGGAITNAGSMAPDITSTGKAMILGF